jgi:nucleoid DNA-binding protein
MIPMKPGAAGNEEGPDTKGPDSAPSRDHPHTANANVTKAELVERIAGVTAVDSRHIQPILDALFGELKNALAQDRTVELRGFGTFELRTRKGRLKARNPKTGVVVQTSAHRVAVFRPGKELKNAVWNLRETAG